MEDEIKIEEISLEDLDIQGEMVPDRIDVGKYMGKDAKIEGIKAGKHPKYGMFLDTWTNLVDTVGKVELKGRKRYWLTEKEKDDGTKYYGWYATSKLAKDLKKFGKSHFSELVGIDVKLKTTEPTDDGKEYLTF